MFPYPKSAWGLVTWKVGDACSQPEGTSRCRKQVPQQLRLWRIPRWTTCAQVVLMTGSDL